MKIDEKKEKPTLKISGGGTHNLKVKEKNKGKLKILLLPEKEYENFKNKKYIGNAIDYTQNWLNLRHNYKDKRVREKFIKFMRNMGNLEQIVKVIKETKDWLELMENTKQNTENVRISLLKLIETKGTPEQVAEEINNTLEWLKEHESNPNVRATLLDLVKARRREESLINCLFKDYIDWLDRNKNHENTIEVRRRFIDYISRIGSYNQKKKVIYDNEIWLNDHKKNFMVKKSLYKLKKSLSYCDDVDKDFTLNVAK